MPEKEKEKGVWVFFELSLRPESSNVMIAITREQQQAQL